MKRDWRNVPVFAAQTSAADNRLAITGFKAWRVKEPSSNRRYTVVRLQSGGGAIGFGEGGPAPATEIATARDAVNGIRATQTELIRHRLNSAPAMEAAVSNALIDLVARSVNLPIYQYLGGPTRFKARVLAHPEGRDEDGMQEPISRARQAGFKAFTVPIPPRDDLWRMQAYTDAVRKRVERIKSIAGAGAELVLDANGTLMPGDAAFIATALERNHLIWFDEPTSVITNDGLAKVTEESVMPVGIGRHIHDTGTFHNLLRWGCVDVLRPSLGLNSLFRVKRMAALAETHYVAVAPYHNGGPIGSLAGIHLAAALTNSFIQQIPIPASRQDAEMRAEITSGPQETAIDGFAQLINKPGLGVQISEQALNKYSEETI